jgi:hypothetical protein
MVMESQTRHIVRVKLFTISVAKKTYCRLKFKWIIFQLQEYAFSFKRGSAGGFKKSAVAGFGRKTASYRRRSEGFVIEGV